MENIKNLMGIGKPTDINKSMKIVNIMKRALQIIYIANKMPPH